MSPWLSNKPPGTVVGAAEFCPRGAFHVAETSSNVNASAVNEAIFFSCTMKSPIVQNEKGTLGRTRGIVNLDAQLTQLKRDRSSLPIHSLPRGHFPFLCSRAIFADSGGVACPSIKSF